MRTTKKKLWGGRFGASTADSVEAFTASIAVDARLYLRAAIAAKEPNAALPVQDWLRQSGLQDARLTPELTAAQKVVTSR